MDIFLVLFCMIFSFVCGVVLTAFVQWYFFNLYIETQPYVGPPSSPYVTPFSMPKGLLEEGGTVGKEPAGSVNALLQFLFQEIRNTKRVRKWFRHRLSLELEELLTRTTTGKLFEKIVLRDLDLGSHLPAIRGIEVKKLLIDSDTQLIDEVELCLDLDYSGGFKLSIDALTRFSKLVFVSVKVNELSGQAMLKFTRHPYTHWCFTFYTDPVLQLSVESQFQGRSWPQINTIIASQIRKSLKKKHTLPFYKIRYKPFFTKPDVDSLVEEEETQPGLLELTVIEASRLTPPASSAAATIFCSVAIDSTAWIELTHSGTASYLTVDVVLSKQPGPNFGASFKQEFIADKYQVGVVVESISNPLYQDLKTGDIVVMVEGKPVQSLNGLHKIIKAAQSKITFRVERRLKSSATGEEKTNHSEPFGLRNRGGPSGDKTDSDSSNPPSTSDSPAKRSVSGSPEHRKDLARLSLESVLDTDLSKPLVFTTKDVPYSKIVQFNETFKITVLPEHKYVNLSLWSRGAGDKKSLLGHVSLPVRSHCCPPSPGHHLCLYSLLPPSPSLLQGVGDSLASHPGFEPCLCFGDVLLSVAFTGNGGEGGGGGVTTGEGWTVPLTPAGPPPPPASPSTHQPTPASFELSPPSGHNQSAELSASQHAFVRTHFEKVTQCGFCFKKIWLKDALQCEGCLMSCHKKCADRAQAAPGGCARGTTRRPSVQPEIITTPPQDLPATPASPLPPPSQNNTVTGGGGGGGNTGTTSSSGSTSGPLGSLLSGLKRAGSTSSLAPPDLSSTPVSPSHSPATSRKASVVDESLFSLRSGDEIQGLLEVLTSRPHDEGLMDAAKSSGKMLFAELPSTERKKKIDDMMAKIKEALDCESRNHSALQKEEQTADNPTTKAKLAFLVGKSEERLQALTVLMLHCCAGLQDTTDQTSAEAELCPSTD